jgi:hypothetical protein
MIKILPMLTRMPHGTKIAAHDCNRKAAVKNNKLSAL